MTKAKNISYNLLDDYGEYYCDIPPIRITLVSNKLKEETLYSLNISARFKKCPDLEKLTNYLIKEQEE